MNTPQDTPAPLILFSLPRSGSTLVQRILGAHTEIATVAEPWILLPLLYTLKEQGSYTEYNHQYTNIAINDFCRELPNGQDDYLTAISNFARELYTKARKGKEHYFLDKTPRYHLISDNVIRLFPDGKFIFLWRNPLAIAASIIETWGSGRWSIYRFKIDLYEGLTKLIDTYSQHRETVHAVRYEDLTTNADAEWKSIFDYLELDYDPELLAQFSKVKFDGQLGDPTGAKQYDAISSEPLHKWKTTLANPIRKAWCRRYLNWIGQERLSIMGYDLAELLDELAAIPSSPRRVIGDIALMSFGVPYCFFETYALKHKLKTLPAWRHIHIHR